MSHHLAAEARRYARTLSALRELARAPVDPDPAGTIRAQLAVREQSFLESVRQVVFSGAPNPYREMFRLAGCEYPDLDARVRRDGLEAALTALYQAGVWLSHDEFKGRTPIVRSGRHIPSSPQSFVNPLVSGAIEMSSSGSRSDGTITRQSPRFNLYRECYFSLFIREFGLDRRAGASLWPIFPSPAGLNYSLYFSRLGCPLGRWFAPGGNWRDSGHYRALTAAMVLAVRSAGQSIPLPRHLPPNDFSPVARWIAGRRSAGRCCAIAGYPSPAVRVAGAALDRGIDISGALFLTSGEAVTAAKRAEIENAGCEIFPYYFISEVGPVGYACRCMKADNCVHLLSDSVAVVTHTRPAPLSGIEVNSLLLTTLLPFSPHVLINSDMEDSGLVEPASCDCVFSSAGLAWQIRNVSSYGKLTGQGVTLVGSEVVEILERALPARFGGHPGDYQLTESEGPRQTQVTLRVSPRLNIASLSPVLEFFLDEVRARHGGTLAARIWRHSRGLDVLSAEPVSTPTGKILPLHLLLSSDS